MALALNPEPCLHVWPVVARPRPEPSPPDLNSQNPAHRCGRPGPELRSFLSDYGRLLGLEQEEEAELACGGRGRGSFPQAASRAVLLDSAYVSHGP